MGVKFRLVSKRNLGDDKEEIPEKIYPQIVAGDYVPFEEFIEEVDK